MMPKQLPEPTAIGAVRSGVVVNGANSWWFSFLRCLL
jgi:hypothetical protein